MKTTPVRLLLAEDHPVTRIGLTELLRSDPAMQVVAECARGPEVIPAVLALRPDVALIDLRLPELDGWTIIAELRRRAPRVRVIAISALDGPDATRRAIDAGARAFLHKGAPADTILATVRRVAHATDPLPETKALLASLPSSEPLTPRELEVLRHLAEGLTNQSIGERLGIGVGTVRTHVANVLAKLGVERRTEAAIAAVRRGLL